MARRTGGRVKSFRESPNRRLAIAQLRSLGGDDDPQRIAELLPNPVRNLAGGNQRRQIDHQLDPAVGGVDALASGPGAPGEAPDHRPGRDGDTAGRDHLAVHAPSVQQPSS
jgi:hypothetical protein